VSLASDSPRDRHTAMQKDRGTEQRSDSVMTIPR
jgi:hypothetical protein